MSRRERYWQQISGRAIAGPLAGSQLELVYSDELTFGLWRREAPDGTVLKPVARYAGEYEAKDWETRMAKVPTVLDFPRTELSSRDLILGINGGRQSRAYPVTRILSEKLIEDRLDGHAILVVTGPDDESIRVFTVNEPVAAEAGEFYRQIDASGALLTDSGTGSGWDFSGCAISGKLAGTCLTRHPAVKDYWFDWRNYHPDTSVFRR